MIQPESARAYDGFVYVPVGGGAAHFIVNPIDDPSVEWMLRYRCDTNGKEDTEARLAAATILDSFDYLLSDEISTSESVRRLRLMRGARMRVKAQKGRTE